jgi:small subunit ribosomal protein S3
VGQKVHPIGFRLGVYRSWDSRWFARRSNYAEQVFEDLKIRNFLEKTLVNAEIARIEIEKAGEGIKVIVHSGRPGVVIGKKGQEIESIRQQLSAMLKVPAVEVSVQEVRQPELDATLVAKNIAQQLEKRASFKKIMKRAALSALKSGAKGVKIAVAGRLNGAEIARTEFIRLGSIPSHTLRANIDYGFAEAHTTFGVIGVKVWICKGEFQLVK